MVLISLKELGIDNFVLTNAPYVQTTYTKIKVTISLTHICCYARSEDILIHL